MADGTTPVSGSYDKMEIWIDGVKQGTLSGITPGLGNFAEIDLPLQAYNVLLGDDTITGSNMGDFLFTGDGGTDTVDAKDGNDFIGMAATAFAPFHSINGGAGIDTIDAVSNVFSADKVLDLRNATLQSIEAFWIEGGVTVRLLGSQIGAGVSSAAEIDEELGHGRWRPRGRAERAGRGRPVGVHRRRRRVGHHVRQHGRRRNHPGPARGDHRGDAGTDRSAAGSARTR